MRNKKVYEAHYIVDGVRFQSVKHAASIARRLGFVGSNITIARRLHHGVRTLAELVASTPPAHATRMDAAAAALKAMRSASRTECADAMRCVDARRAAIAALSERDVEAA